LEEADLTTCFLVSLNCDGQVAESKIEGGIEKMWPTQHWMRMKYSPPGCNVSSNTPPGQAQQQFSAKEDIPISQAGSKGAEWGGPNQVGPAEEEAEGQLGCHHKAPAVEAMAEVHHHIETDTEDDNFPAMTVDMRCHHCYVSILEPMGKIYTDQTGKFVQASSNSNNYLLFLYDFDRNCILAEPSNNTPAYPSLPSTKHYIQNCVKPASARASNTSITSAQMP
jgi:hypothetical protein